MLPKISSITKGNEETGVKTRSNLISEYRRKKDEVMYCMYRELLKYLRKKKLIIVVLQLVFLAVYVL